MFYFVLSIPRLVVDASACLDAWGEIKSQGLILLGLLVLVLLIQTPFSTMRPLAGSGVVLALPSNPVNAK